MNAYDGNKILTFYKEAKDCLERGLCTPRTALIYPSRVCNQHCYFCIDKITNTGFTKDLKVRFMNRDLFLNLPKELKNLGCEAVELCGGGEPFLHPDIEEFILECKKYNLKLGSLTNGTCLSGSLADLVIDNFSFVRISLDSFNSETYQSIRQTSLNGKDSLSEVLRNLRYLVQRKREVNSRILITVKSVFNKDTIHEMTEYIKIARTYKVDGIHIKGVRNVENELDLSVLDPIYEKILEDEKKQNRKGEPFVFGSLNNTVIESPFCFACSFDIFIDTDGSLRLCCYYQNREEDHTYARITSDTLSNLRLIWEGLNHHKALKKIDTSKCNLYNCKYHSYNNVLYEGIIEDQGQWQFT